jgi:mannose-6-phosphate isomerase-like protein (cupin superfamily)
MADDVTGKGRPLARTRRRTRSRHLTKFPERRSATQPRPASESGTKTVSTVEAMNVTVRRVVAANTGGISRVVEDGEPPRTAVFTAPKGLVQSLVWRTPPVPPLSYDGTEPATAAHSILPQPGGTSLFVLTLPPDAVHADPSFDPAAAAAEAAKHSPGLAELFEPDNPGMHATPTVDYVVVLDGELWLELTDGEVHLTAGDVVVQHGTRHAWRNRSGNPATLLAVLIGARDAQSHDGR